MKMQKTGLDPWRVLLSHLMDVDSYIIPDIVNRTGMIVDWNLSERENYSHKYRKDAFRPRIIGAYQSLSESEQLRVSYVIVEELKKLGSKNAINADLEKIGWSIGDSGLIPVDANVKELFFPSGSQHDAYVEIRNILQQATSNITVIDPYIDSSLFVVLKTISSQALRIRTLTFKIPSDFVLET